MLFDNEKTLIKIAKVISTVGILWHIFAIQIQATSPGILRKDSVLFELK